MSVRLFEREHEIVARVAAAHAALWKGSSTIRVVRAERGYGRGVADLVVLDFDPAVLAWRREAGIPPVGGPSEAAVLAAFRTSGSMRLEVLRGLVPDVSSRHLRALVRRLVDTGHVREAPDGTLEPMTRPLIRRAIAVEAKLTDWRSGLLQASRYHSFADRCYVALPEQLAQRLAAQRPVLHGLNVGVISVGERVRVVVGAPAGRPTEPAIRCWAEEAEAAALLGVERRLIAPFPARFAAPSPEQLVPRTT